MSVVASVYLASTIMMDQSRASVATETLTPMPSIAFCNETIDRIVETVQTGKISKFKKHTSLNGGVVLEYEFNYTNTRRELTCISS